MNWAFYVSLARKCPLDLLALSSHILFLFLFVVRVQKTDTVFVSLFIHEGAAEDEMAVEVLSSWTSSFHVVSCHIAQCRMSSQSRRLPSVWKQRRLEIDMHTRHNPITTNIKFLLNLYSSLNLILGIKSTSLDPLLLGVQYLFLFSYTTSVETQAKITQTSSYHPKTQPTRSELIFEFL